MLQIFPCTAYFLLVFIAMLIFKVPFVAYGTGSLALVELSESFFIWKLLALLLV
jgi:hypothetical protein